MGSLPIIVVFNILKFIKLLQGLDIIRHQPTKKRETLKQIRYIQNKFYRLRIKAMNKELNFLFLEMHLLY